MTADQALQAIRAYPISTHADLLALLSATVSRLSECSMCDMGAVLYHLADAESALECAPVLDRDAMARDQAEMWREEESREFA